MPNEWITDWSEIFSNDLYIVCPINSRREDESLYLGQPLGIYMGWEVKRLMEKCYAALQMPEFDGRSLYESSNKKGKSPTNS